MVKVPTGSIWRSFSVKDARVGFAASGALKVKKMMKAAPPPMGRLM